MTAIKRYFSLEYWDDNRHGVLVDSVDYDTLEEAEQALAYERDHRLPTESWTRLVLMENEDHYEDGEVVWCVPVGAVESYDLYEDSGKYVVNLDGGYVDFEWAMSCADEELCEELHNKMAPCSKQEFFNAYGHAHYERFGEDFAPFAGGTTYGLAYDNFLKAVGDSRRAASALGGDGTAINMERGDR